MKRKQTLETRPRKVFDCPLHFGFLNRNKPFGSQVFILNEKYLKFMFAKPKPRHFRLQLHSYLLLLFERRVVHLHIPFLSSRINPLCCETKINAHSSRWVIHRLGGSQAGCKQSPAEVSFVTKIRRK